MVQLIVFRQSSQNLMIIQTVNIMKFKYKIKNAFFFSDPLQTWVQIPREDKGRQHAWKKLFAVLTNSKFLLYNSEKDQYPFISIDLKYRIIF